MQFCSQKLFVFCFSLRVIQPHEGPPRSGTEDTSVPSKGPVFHTPMKVDISSIIMSEKTLDLSILSQTPSIVTNEHLALINDLLDKATKKEEWEVSMCVCMYESEACPRLVKFDML